jgi:hypothetical protein
VDQEVPVAGDPAANPYTTRGGVAELAEGSDLESRRTREGPVGSNPTSSALSTSTFTKRDDLWSALGPCRVGERGGAHLRRRWALACRHADLATRNDRVPRITRCPLTRAGEQLRVRVPAGGQVPDLEAEAERIAAFLGVREVRITREPDSARHARVVVLRRDPLADPQPVRWPLARPGSCRCGAHPGRPGPWTRTATPARSWRSWPPSWDRACDGRPPPRFGRPAAPRRRPLPHRGPGDAPGRTRHVSRRPAYWIRRTDRGLPSLSGRVCPTPLLGCGHEQTNHDAALPRGRRRRGLAGAERGRLHLLPHRVVRGRRPARASDQPAARPRRPPPRRRRAVGGRDRAADFDHARLLRAARS